MYYIPDNHIIEDLGETKHPKKGQKKPEESEDTRFYIVIDGIEMEVDIQNLAISSHSKRSFEYEGLDPRIIFWNIPRKSHKPNQTEAYKINWKYSYGYVWVTYLPLGEYLGLFKYHTKPASHRARIDRLGSITIAIYENALRLYPIIANKFSNRLPKYQHPFFLFLTAF